MLLIGCSGGGGRSPQPPDPGVLPDDGPAVADTRTRAIGLIILSNPPADPEARAAALTGTEVTVQPSGQRYVVRASPTGGLYHVDLVRGERNTITARKAGVRFPVMHFTPRGPFAVSPGIGAAHLGEVSDELPVLEGELLEISAPAEQGVNIPLVRVPVATRLQVDPTTGALDAVLHGQRIIIRNAANNRILERLTVDNQNRAVYEATLGQEIIVEPAARRGVRWYPSSRRMRVDGRPPELVFEWRADAREEGPPRLNFPGGWPQPAATPTPIPRIPPPPGPRSTPVPRIPLPQAARPPSVIPAPESTPLPRLQPRPILRLPNNE